MNNYKVRRWIESLASKGDFYRINKNWYGNASILIHSYDLKDADDGGIFTDEMSYIDKSILIPLPDVNEINDNYPLYLGKDFKASFIEEDNFIYIKEKVFFNAIRNATLYKVVSFYKKIIKKVLSFISDNDRLYFLYDGHIAMIHIPYSQTTILIQCRVEQVYE